MERYAVIHDKFPREFILLQGRGCRWGQCTFCDYHHDTSDDPFGINKEVLKRVTGEYGVLDIINSGSGIELDEQTIELIKEVVREKRIHTLWFEMHYMYRHRLAKFAAQFAPAKVKFRCGIETFDGAQRKRWNKGVAADVTVDDVARYFQGVCLLCCTRGESRERISGDIHLAEKYFEYFSVNLFCNNGTSHERDEELVTWFIDELYPGLKDSPKAEVLLNNTDLTVGG